MDVRLMGPKPHVGEHNDSQSSVNAALDDVHRGFGIAENPVEDEVDPRELEMTQLIYDFE